MQSTEVEDAFKYHLSVNVPSFIYTCTSLFLFKLVLLFRTEMTRARQPYTQHSWVRSVRSAPDPESAYPTRAPDPRLWYVKAIRWSRISVHGQNLRRLWARTSYLAWSIASWWKHVKSSKMQTNINKHYIYDKIVPASGRGVTNVNWKWLEVFLRVLQKNIFSEASKETATVNNAILSKS